MLLDPKWHTISIILFLYKSTIHIWQLLWCMNVHFYTEYYFDDFIRRVRVVYVLSIKLWEKIHKTQYSTLNSSNIWQISWQTHSGIHGQTIHPMEKFISLIFFDLWPHLTSLLSKFIAYSVFIITNDCQ